MTISNPNYGSIGGGTSSSISVAYPSGIQANDLLVMHYVQKASPGYSPSTPSGWTKQVDQAGGGTSSNMYVLLFTKVADGTESGNVTVTGSSGVMKFGRIYIMRSTEGKVWDIASGAYTVTTATDLDGSGTLSSDVKPDDTIFTASGIYYYGTDPEQSIGYSMTGITFGTMYDRPASYLYSGNYNTSICGNVAYSPVSSGTASGTPTLNYTSTYYSTPWVGGTLGFLRLRDVAKAGSAVATNATPAIAASSSVAKSGGASDVSVSPSTAASGTVAKAGSAAVTPVVATASSGGPMSKSFSVSLAVAPSVAASGSPIVDTGSASITVAPTTAVSAATSKPGSASVTFGFGATVEGGTGSAANPVTPAVSFGSALSSVSKPADVSLGLDAATASSGESVRAAAVSVTLDAATSSSGDVLRVGSGSVGVTVTTSADSNLKPKGEGSATPFLSVSTSSSGALTRVVVAQLVPFVTTEASGSVAGHRFRNPSYEEPTHKGRWNRRTHGITLVRNSGVWSQQVNPADTQLAAADMYLQGGRDHWVSETVADELTAAGYTVTLEAKE